MRLEDDIETILSQPSIEEACQAAQALAAGAEADVAAAQAAKRPSGQGEAVSIEWVANRLVSARRAQFGYPARVGDPFDDELGFVLSKDLSVVAESSDPEQKMQELAEAAESEIQAARAAKEEQ